MKKIIQVSLAQLLIVFVLFGCEDEHLTANATDIDSETLPLQGGNWYQPPISTTWQWQLMDEVNNSYNVDMYDIDLFDSSRFLIQDLQNLNIKVICYFSAGTYEDWRSDMHDFNESELGNTLDAWPGEHWLDIRSENVFSIMKKRLDLAVEKGCDGVEPDNLDGYSNNPGFDFTSEDQLIFNRKIANEAHLRNLSVGLKNDLDQVNDLVDYYDFAVNEQCFEYDECDLLSPFIKNEKPVFNAEYSEGRAQAVTKKNVICSESLSLQFSTLILSQNLDDEFRISCL